jgi:predicted ester cyclase
MVAEGDWIATRFTVHGTHEGELLGVPASGRKVTFTGMSMTRVQGKRVAVDLTEVDMASFLQQVGAMPAPAAAHAA